MKKRAFLFSFLAVATFAATSCSGAEIRHTKSIDNAVYQADLDHDGKIDNDNLPEEKLTWQNAYDLLLAEANSTSTISRFLGEDCFKIDKNDPYAIPLARYEILHQAEELVMSTGSVLPLCNYIDPYLLKPDLDDIYTVNLGFKFIDRLTRRNKPGDKSFTVTMGTKAESFDPAVNSDASTAQALYQCMVGAVRYVKGNVQEGEEERGGVYDAVLDTTLPKSHPYAQDGVCTVEKKIVTKDDKEGDEWIKIDECPDLMEYIKDGRETRDDYDGTARYTITLKNNACWNDGEPMVIDDFIYAWKRASSAIYNGEGFGVWSQLFDSIRGFNVWNTIGQQPDKDYKKWDEESQEKWTNTDPKKGTVLTDVEKDYYMDVFDDQGCSGGMIGIIKNNNQSVTIQLTNDCSYFEELLAFTAFFPVRKDKILIVPDEDKGETEKSVICKEKEGWWLNKNKDFYTNGTLEIDGPIDNNDGGGIKFKKCENTLENQFKGEKGEIIDSLRFMFIDKDSTMYDTYRTDKVVLTNNFPIAVVDKLKTSKDWHAPEQIGSYFYTFNVNDNTFDIAKEKDPISGERNREALRIAFAKLINRHDIAYNVYKKGTSANGYVSTGVSEYEPHVLTGEYQNGWIVAKRKGSMPDPDTPTEAKDYFEQEPVVVSWQDRNKNHWDLLDKTERYKNEGWLQHRNGQDGGFFETVEDDADLKDGEEERVMKKTTSEAIELAKKAGVHYNEKTGKFINFPRVTITTNNGTAHEDVAERIQAYMSLWGIDVDVQTMEWQSFVSARRTGDYAAARQGWLADYNDPRTYLDCNRSTDGNDDTQLGKDSWHRSH